jgi:hypothetical protein
MGAFGGFARMWLLFEGTLCRGAAHPAAFVRIALAVAPARTSAGTLATIEDFAQFWAERMPDLQAQCARLLAEAQAADAGDGRSVPATALRLMLSAQKVRQSLLHQTKAIDALNEQLEILDVASQSLGALLLAAGPGIVIPPGRRAPGAKRRAPPPSGGA